MSLQNFAVKLIQKPNLKHIHFSMDPFETFNFILFIWKNSFTFLCSVSGEWRMCIYGFRFLLCCYIDNGQSIFWYFYWAIHVQFVSEAVLSVNVDDDDDDDGIPMVSVLWYLNKSSDWLFDIHTHTYIHIYTLVRKVGLTSIWNAPLNGRPNFLTGVYIQNDVRLYLHSTSSSKIILIIDKKAFRILWTVQKK